MLRSFTSSQRQRLKPKLNDLEAAEGQVQGEMPAGGASGDVGEVAAPRWRRWSHRLSRRRRESPVARARWALVPHGLDGGDTASVGLFIYQLD